MRVRSFVHRLAIAFALAAACAVALHAAAVGSDTVTTLDVGGGVTKYTLAWTSSAGGAVSGNPFSLKRGELLQVKFVPGAGGTQPTNLYTATLIDTDSVDVLAGAGVGSGLSNSVSTISIPQFGTGSASAQRYFHDATEVVDLVIASAGNAKTGTVMLWVR